MVSNFFATASRSAKNFLDGDLIESYLDLDRNQKDEIASAMELPREKLCMMVSWLKELH